MENKNKKEGEMGEEGKFLKNIGNKLADEDDNNLKSGNANKELQDLNQAEEQKWVTL